MVKKVWQTDRRTDGQTDRQTDGLNQSYSCLVAAKKKNPSYQKLRHLPENDNSYLDTMTGTNSSNDRLILRRNVEINSNWYFSYDVFSGIKSSTTWNGNVIAQSPRKMSQLRDISNTSDIRFSMVYRTIIDVILQLFIICNDLRCQLPFFSQTFRHNGSAVFGTMPPMCRSCLDVNKLRGMDTTILGKHRPFMSIKSFVQHSGWQEMVSLCSLIRLIGVCADRDQPEFLCSRSDSRNFEVHVATAGGWLTRYRHVRLETRYIDIGKSISIIDRNFYIDLYRLYR